MPHNILSIQNISKTYHNRQILENISLELRKGEVVGLFGPNGAGKTTCFNIIAGLVKANSGKLLFGNQDITNFPIYLRAKLGISYLPQESSIFSSLSVEDNIRIIAEIWHNSKKEQNQIIDTLLTEFNIDHLRRNLAVSLSGGERRRLEIARMLAGFPKFIMLDEPLAGVDPIAINSIKYLIMKLKERNIGILITDHNVRDSLNIIDRGYIIYGGRVLLHGSPQEIINSTQVQEVYLGQSFYI